MKKLKKKVVYINTYYKKIFYQDKNYSLQGSYFYSNNTDHTTTGRFKNSNFNGIKVEIIY